MQDIINTGNAYQGQLKASTVEGGYFQAGHDYFTDIANMTDGELNYITKLGIYWDRPGNKRIDSDDIPRDKQGNKKFDPNYIPMVELKPIGNSSIPVQFEIGYNYMLELKNIRIDGITFTHDSSSKCFIDFIGILKESN